MGDSSGLKCRTLILVTDCMLVMMGLELHRTKALPASVDGRLTQRT